MSKCPIQDGCSLTSQDKRILPNTTFLSDAAEFSAELILIRTPLLKKSLLVSFFRLLICLNSAGNLAFVVISMYNTKYIRDMYVAYTNEKNKKKT